MENDLRWPEPAADRIPVNRAVAVMIPADLRSLDSVQPSGGCGGRFRCTRKPRLSPSPWKRERVVVGQVFRRPPVPATLRHASIIPSGERIRVGSLDCATSGTPQCTVHAGQVTSSPASFHQETNLSQDPLENRLNPRNDLLNLPGEIPLEKRVLSGHRSRRSSQGRPSQDHVLAAENLLNRSADHFGKQITRQPVTMVGRHPSFNLFLVALLVLLEVPDRIEVSGHGRLMDPPSRNSMWRVGFPNPLNYNDNELFCGGYAVQWEQNGGQCGVCGDAYHLNRPRPHEAGGMFARGTIVRRYSPGQDIDIEVELTANHQGRFEMYLCPNNNPQREATQDCFDRHPLYLSGTQSSHYEIPSDSQHKGIFRYRVRLPPYVTCTQCVIQWNYYTGNMWGTCPNGTEAVGCGRSETFRNCADVSIVSSTGAVPPQFAPYDNPYLVYYKDSTKGYYSSLNDDFPTVVRSQMCRGSRAYRLVPGMGDWCQNNCMRYPPFCPTGICECPETCDAIGDIAGKAGADVYCLDKCLVYPSNCPSHRCNCY